MPSVLFLKGPNHMHSKQGVMGTDHMAHIHTLDKAFAVYNSCLNKQLTLGLIGPFHFSHSRSFVPFVGGALRVAAELLAFSYLHCQLPLLLQGIKHHPAQLLDIMLLPS